MPKSWIPDRPNEPDGITVTVPDPRPPPQLQSNVPSPGSKASAPPALSTADDDPDAPPAPIGPVCAPKGARQSPEHNAAFEKGLRLIFDGDTPAAIAALEASLDAAANNTERTLTWQVLGDLYQAEGMTAQYADAQQAISDLGCAQPAP